MERMKDSFKLVFSATLPPDQRLLELLLQLIRDFDMAHDGCHFQITATTNLSLTEMETALNKVTPPFRHRMTLRKH